MRCSAGFQAYVSCLSLLFSSSSLLLRNSPLLLSAADPFLFRQLFYVYRFVLFLMLESWFYLTYDNDEKSVKGRQQKKAESDA